MNRRFPHILKPIGEASRFLALVLREFLHDHGPIMAAAMSFFATLSIFPILLLGLSALGYIYRGKDPFEELMSVVGQAAPKQVADVVRVTLENVVHTRRKVLIIGVLTLLWTATNVFANMETALCITWGVQKRPFWKSRLLALAMLLLVGMALALTLAFASLALRIEGLSWTILGYRVPELPFVWHALGFAISAVIGVLTFSIVYRALPNTHVHGKAAVLGGAFSGILWQTALQAFTLYLNNAHYDVVYGSLGGVIMLILWIYYSMIVLLLGAEVAWQADQRLRARRGQPAETPREKLHKPAPLP
ncbi:MAG TPA: YihY/virulence factor BrkB family protein [Armatimonadota bacterium]|jgi:membrane protein